MVGRKPKLEHIRKFGSVAYVHIPKPRRTDKFAPQAKRGFYIGVSAGNGHRTFIPSLRQVIVTRDAYFLEDATCTHVIKKSMTTQVFESAISDETSDTEVEIPTSPSNNTNHIDAETEGNTVSRTPGEVTYHPRDHADPGEVHNRRASTVLMIRQ